ncbi:MAG: chloramphenicol phosphotransferase CPT family protein [Candidatus Limnocylindria bacterium]
MHSRPAGQIVVLNGAPRSGQSSIVLAIQETFDGVWMNIGVDVFARRVTPRRYRPGMGLRPGEEEHDLYSLQPALYAAFYDSIAAHSRSGLNVLADVGHHRREILVDCARRLKGLPALLVGVRCPIEVVMQRRNTSPVGEYATGSIDDPPLPVRRWQTEVHHPGIYDLEVDTSMLSPSECAELIRRRLLEGAGTAFTRLARLAD